MISVKYEYKQITVNAAYYNLVDRLNEYGAEGWEIVSHHKGQQAWNHELVLKRIAPCSSC